jgi:hypothetical protein
MVEVGRHPATQKVGRGDLGARVAGHRLGCVTRLRDSGPRAASARRGHVAGPQLMTERHLHSESPRKATMSGAVNGEANSWKVTMLPSAINAATISPQQDECQAQQTEESRRLRSLLLQETRSGHVCLSSVGGGMFNASKSDHPGTLLTVEL